MNLSEEAKEDQQEYVRYMFMYFNTLYLLIIKNLPKASQAKSNMEDKEKNRQLWESLFKSKKITTL